VFELTDLFAFGLGCELAGAYLLARGLLRSPRAIRRRSTFGGIYPGGVMDDADDRVLASWGVFGLLVGFAVQLVAYLVILGSGTSPEASCGRAAIGAIAALVPGAAILGAERWTHKRRVDTLIVRIAREDLSNGITRDEPDLDLLVKVADWRGEKRCDDESDVAYARRVFRCEPDAFQAGVHTAAEE
jgi:hypothetical protein